MLNRLICLITLMLLFAFQPASAAEGIKLGAIFAKTGAAAPSNQAQLIGIRYAIKKINSQGGVLGRPMELIEYDNRGTQLGSKAAAQQAVRDNVVAVVGPSWSSHSLAAAPVLQEAGVVMLTPYSTHVDVTKIGNYIFRSCFTDLLQGKLLAQFAIKDLKLKTAAIMVDVKSDYSIGLAKYIKDNFVQMGGIMLTEQHYTHNQHDFSKQLKAIKELHPGVIFIPGHDEGIFIARQAQSLAIDAIPIFGDGVNYTSAIEKGSGTLYKGYFTAHWDKAATNKRSRKFVVDIEKEGIETISKVALVYDSVLLLKDAISRAGSTDREAIRLALADTQGFQGVSGTFSFDKNGDPVKGVTFMELRQGKSVFYKEFTP